MQVHVEERTLHFKKPARTSRGAYTEHRIFIITLTDSLTGRAGVGECAPLPDLSCDRDAYPDAGTVRAMIESALASGDAPECLRQHPALLFAVESALHGMNQSPILYGTPFAHSEEGIPVNGLIWMDSYEHMLEQVENKLKDGFACIKLKIGAIDWEDELKLVRLIRSRYSPDELQLRVDANGGFSPSETMKKLYQLAELGIHSIEQPVKAVWQHEGVETWDVMAELCRDTPIPIALDEELIGVNDRSLRISLLESIRPQCIVVKPSLHGGISGALEWIGEASKRGIGSWITSALESNVGLKNVALLAAHAYGPEVKFAQGLGTGLLYTDNIEAGTELRGSSLWLRK